MDIKVELEKVKEGLIQQRDELKVRAHLAKLEALEEWQEAEQKLEELESRLNAMGAEAKNASEDVWASARLLGDEIKSAYERIKSKAL